jgi:hypothetical protein
MVDLKYTIPREGPEVMKFLWEKANLSGRYAQLNAPYATPAPTPCNYGKM